MDGSPNRRHPGLTALVATVVALVLVSASLIVGRLSTPVPAPPTTRSAEAGFARDMQVHHAQAVRMSMTVRDRTDDPEVRLLAYDIATAQSQQSGQMFGWLALWGLPQASPEPAMTWMHRAAPGADGHAHAGPVEEPPEAMPGLATQEQLDALEAASGADAERLFLELMIAHHLGGIEMAEGVEARGSEPVVLDLAGSMVASQRGEIDLMERLLADRT